jgi:Large eukaryotic DNA virus major capsid protein
VGLKRITNSNDGLRYSLVPIKYTERWGINDHEVKIDVTFRAASQCYVTDDLAAPTSGTPSLSNASLYVDYIYLDTDERRQFAQVQHEYLIEQVQFSNTESYSNSAINKRLAFNHPVKFLAFVCQLDANVDSGANRWMDFTTSGSVLADAYKGGEPLTNFKLQLNGHDRFSTRAAAYFNLVQPYQHFPAGPATGIYAYSFALNPTEHQPSGSVNMSRIDNATMSLTLSTGTSAGKLHVYAFGYNVLRVMAGMGGLAYSN